VVATPHRFFGDKPYTTGDVLMIREATSLGGYIALRSQAVTKLESVRLNMVLVNMALVNSFAYWEIVWLMKWILPRAMW